MTRRLFEEVQSYRQYRPFWYGFIVLSLMIFTPVLYGMYGQLVLGIPWGNKPIEDSGLIALFFFLVFIVGIVTIALLAIKMETFVDANGIHYKSHINKAKWVTIAKDKLDSLEIRQNRRTIFEPGGLSFYKKYAGKMTYAMLRGGLHLELTLTNKSKVFLGTQRPDELARAIKKMIEIDTSYHG
jgi:hypothetical protein